jgi:hypothetical protein
VYVYGRGKAQLTRVVVGYRDDKEAEIVSGLTAEDRVVVNPTGLYAENEVEVEVEKTAPPK